MNIVRAIVPTTWVLVASNVPPTTPPNKRDHLAKVDKAFLPKLGNETKAHRPIDVREGLAGDLLDGLLC